MAGRVVVVTGASSGIGAELATLLGSRGDSVVLVARREAEVRTVPGAHDRVVRYYVELGADPRTAGTSPEAS